MLGSQKPCTLISIVYAALDDQAYIGVPSCGLRKRTPSSVTLASLRRLTIWNLVNTTKMLVSPRITLHPHPPIDSPTTISQYIAAPSLQIVSTSNLLQRLLSWLESQMIGVVQTQITPGPGKLRGCKAFERGLSSDWHKNG